MYDFIDRPVATLDNGGRFLVWAMRNWVQAMGERRCPTSAIGPAFLKWRVDRALPDFHMAMMILNKEGLLTLHFAPARCLNVSEDEAMLLQLFRSVRDDSSSRVTHTLKLLVEEQAVPALLTALARVSMRLGIAGLVPAIPAQSRTAGIE
jgi:hypothetical protein